MRVSYNWLKELLPELTLPPLELAARLTALGLEVDGVKAHGLGLEDVLVVSVEKIEPHPERDKLRLVTVSKGKGETQRVVCGASNVPAPGGLIVLAPLGTHLPAVNMTLTPRTIAGVLSEGMLCSERELGLSEHGEGILILPAGSAEPGQKFTAAFPEAVDTVIEISVTPNRPDALGHIGVARDLSAALELPLVLPRVPPELPSSEIDFNTVFSLENRAPERCPSYGAALVTDVKVGPSPLWLAWRLERLGIRPISNVVDITNLLLLEYGQPMHAFDFELIAGRKIVVRAAANDESFTSLDGVDRKLTDDDLVICDAERAVALAGIMGGQNTEIRPTTSQVLLECAYFTPTNIRRSSRRHGLHTESSHRFERGVNWACTAAVLARSTALLCELAGAKVAREKLIDQPGVFTTPSIPLRESRLNRLLGVRVPFGEGAKILNALGFKVTLQPATPDGANATVEGAPWRPDVTLEVDLVEEILRVRGCDSIPSALPKIAPQPVRTTAALERNTRRAAEELGLAEAVTYAFVSVTDHRAFGIETEAVTLTNPLSAERSVMRMSLLPGLVEVLTRARRRGELNARLFTVGSVFLAPKTTPQESAAQAARPESPEDLGTLPDERPIFAAVLAGDRHTYLGKPQALDIYDAKGVALGMLERLTRQKAKLVPMGEARPCYLHPRGAASIEIAGQRVGTLGPLHPDQVEHYDLSSASFAVELDLRAVEQIGRRVAKYKPTPRLPAVSRDLALELRKDIPAAEVENIIKEVGGDLCESVELFDLFEGGSIKEGFRSLAFHVIYRDPKAATAADSARTLTDLEVDERHALVVRAASERVGATLRA